MNELLPMITERDGIPVTTSRAVAEQFGKQHKNVIQAIEGLRATLDETEDGKAFNRLNFQPVTLPDAKGESRPAYILTRDGFTLLAMGFTGAKAVQFKVAYINAFNRMERLIKGGGVSAPALQSIERRLEALEAIAGDGREEAGEDVASIFLQAIRAAIESGEYYIRDKWQRTKGKTAGHLLGVIDGSKVCVKSWQAYKIYSSAVPAPMKVTTLWGVLEEFKAIAPRVEVGRQKSIDRKRVSVIYIDADKLLNKSRQRGAENNG